MEVVREASAGEIETHLVQLGSGNHHDNLMRVAEHPERYLVELTLADFNNLIFLQIPGLMKIVPRDHDRRLVAVAARALSLAAPERCLTSNWDLRLVSERFRACGLSSHEAPLPPLLIRDVRGDSERQWAANGWYLQDGSHRGLGYCMAILAGEIEFSGQTAFCVTTRTLA